MKILLVNPPTPETFYNREFYPPSSLLYLGAVLQENKKEVKILDFKTFQRGTADPSFYFYEKLLIKTINSFKPELIGIGCLFSGNFLNLLNLSIAAKKIFPDIPIVIGGIHPTIYPSEILMNCPSIDFIVIGEGEKSIVQLVNKLEEKKYNFEDIDGLAYRLHGEVKVNPKINYIDNPDTLPLPAYNLIRLEDYYVDTSKWHNPKNLPINTSLPIISSRSCPNQCPFCCMYKVMGPKWRSRSPENVVGEIEYLYQTYGHRHFSFMDDNFTLIKSRVLEICDLIIEKKLNIQFETPNGLSIKTLDAEVLEALIEAGLVRTSLAIESGSDYIRNYIMKKNLSREKIFEVVNLIKKYPRLFINLFFIIGMPEETEKTLDETYKMIKEIQANKVHIMGIVPYPGTKVYEQAIRDNLLVDIDVKNLYKSGELYLKNYNRFFIKPYKLEIDTLHKFRDKVNDLIAVQNLNRAK